MAKSKILQIHEDRKKRKEEKVKRESMIPQSKKSFRVSGIFRDLNYDEMPKSRSVVVVCAGPSLNKYSTEVVEYIKNNKSLVFAANYNFENLGIKSNYTYITDQNKLIENITKIKSHLVIPVKMKTDHSLDYVEKCLKPYNGKVKNFISQKFDVDAYKVYHVGLRGKSNVYSVEDKLIMGKSGLFPYKRLGSAGQGSIMISMLARPEKMLIVGLDGPNKEAGKFAKQLFDGRSVDYDQDKFIRMANYIKGILLPFVRSKNIIIETFNDVAFYGLDKSKLKVKIIG